MELAYTSRQVTDLEYYSFSEHSYKTNLRVDDDIKITDSDVEWRVLKQMDEENGAQGIALAPILADGKVDTSQIVIAYRGTEFGEWDGDVTADTLQVVLNSKYIPTIIDTPIGPVNTLTSETQFHSALTFSDSIAEEYKNAQISYTGHSLGGGLAQYVAAERNLSATTFAAPNVYGLLSDEAKERVDAGETRNTIRDYIHEKDLVGEFSGGDPLIGKQYITAVKENSLPWWNPIGGHFMGTYTGYFSEDGSIQFRMEPEEMVKAIKAFRPRLEQIKNWRKLIERYVDDEVHEVKEIYNDMLNNVNGSGKYPLLSEHDVTDYFREKAMTVKGSDYYFINVDLAMDFCRELTKFEQKMEKFLDELIQAAETTGTLDTDISTWYGGIGSV